MAKTLTFAERARVVEDTQITLTALNAAASRAQANEDDAAILYLHRRVTSLMRDWQTKYPKGDTNA